MNYCRCNRCGKKVQGQPRRWRFLTQQFGSRGLLRANFICSKCKHGIKNNPVLWAFTESGPIRHLKWNIENEMQLFEDNAYNQPFPQRAETFKQRIHDIMSTRFIKNYNFVVADNKLRAILINEIPFLGSYELKLNETHPKEKPPQA